MGELVQKIGLVDLIREAHISTIKADQMAMREYLSILQELRDMPPISFGFNDDQGRRVRLQIPVITLIPLSLLRVEEAEFSCSCELEINQSKEENSVGYEPVLAEATEAKTLTLVYDNKLNRKYIVDEIKIYQSVTSPQRLIFQIKNRGRGSDEPTYFSSDPSKPLKKKSYVLLSLGRPYVTLWEDSFPTRNISQFEQGYQLFLTLYPDGTFRYNNHLYRKNKDSSSKIEINRELGGERRYYAHKHIAPIFSLRMPVDKLSGNEENTRVVLHKTQENQVTNFSFKVKLNQTPIPNGIIDILGTLGNNVKLSEEY